VRDEPREPEKVGADGGQILVPESARQTRPVACAFANGRAGAKRRNE